MTTQELIAWHAAGRAAATVATVIRTNPPITQAHCEECWGTHTSRRKCPGCRACDWSPTRPCWNCEDNPRLAN